MTRDEINAVAKLIKRMAVQLEQERSAHKTALAEMRTSFVARTGADEKLIEDRRMEIIRLNGANDRLNDLLRVERLAHRDEVAALQERLRSSIARGDFAQMEVAAPKSRTPKHPVKVGEWVHANRALVACDDDPSQLEHEVVHPNGQKGRWPATGCEPCEPPAATVKLAPKVGDTVRLVTHPERAQVAEHLRTALQWPWISRWGLVGQTGKVVKPRRPVAGTVAVALDDNSAIIAWWPIDCLEVVAEATHDTEAGKAAAESAVRPDPMCVGNEVEVIGRSVRKVTT